MKKTFTQKQISKKGFTIIETLVAIFVLLIATTGPLTFAQSGLRSSFLARDQITAFYLAQDAVEILKNIRDETVLENKNSPSPSDWLAYFPANCKPVSVGESVACNFDDTLAHQLCTLATGCSQPLYIDSSTKKFSIQSGANRTPSRYTRTVYLTELVDSEELQIIVKVEWDSNFFAEKRIIIQENLYNI